MVTVKSKSGKILIVTMFILTAVLGTFSHVFAEGVPSPQGNYYYDSAGVMSDDTKSIINNVNSGLNAETGAQIVVAAVSNMGDYATVEDYASDFFQVWQIGDAERDNGVLLIASIDDRQMRIEVGYGLEGKITDGRAGQILDEYVVPYFKEGNYDQGLLNGFLAIKEDVQEAYGTEAGGTQQAVSGNDEYPEILYMIAGILFFVVFGAFVLLTVFPPGLKLIILMIYGAYSLIIGIPFGFIKARRIYDDVINGKEVKFGNKLQDKIASSLVRKRFNKYLRVKGININNINLDQYPEIKKAWGNIGIFESKRRNHKYIVERIFDKIASMRSSSSDDSYYSDSSSSSSSGSSYSGGGGSSGGGGASRGW